MNCEEIPALLAAEPDGGCKRVSDAYPNCHCESVTVCPDLSPGPVGDEETVARFVAPGHFDTATRKVKPSLFSHAGKSGMSVTRIEKAGDKELYKQQTRGNYLGYVDSKCADMRSLVFEQQRTFCIYDTAKSDNQFHADICQAVHRPLSKTSAMRRDLQVLFSGTVTVVPEPVNKTWRTIQIGCG